MNIIHFLLGMLSTKEDRHARTLRPKSLRMSYHSKLLAKSNKVLNKGHKRCPPLPSLLVFFIQEKVLWVLIVKPNFKCKKRYSGLK